jgi:uncharacterized membrane protein YedE/YeeE
MAIFLAVTLALVLGFAAHRASVCTVRAVAEVASSRRGAIFVSIGKSVLWVWVVVLPAFWLVPDLGTGLSGWSLTSFAVLGGFLFGLGAAINGGCAYSTMARFVDGDGKMLAAIAGFSAGIVLFAILAGAQILPRPVPAPALVGSFVPMATLPAVALIVAILTWALYEGLRLWRTRPVGKRIIDLVLAPRYRLSTAALLIGLPGAVLFLMYGAFGYTATFDLIVEGAAGTRPWPSATRTILLLAVLAGMAVSTVQRGSFRLDWRPRTVWLQNLFGGALMGLGTALAPGGNDAVVLYGIPTLSPYAAPAFAAMLAGIAAGLFALRALFAIEARVECRNDIFVADTWTRPIPDGTKPSGGEPTR